MGESKESNKESNISENNKNPNTQQVFIKNYNTSFCKQLLKLGGSLLTTKFISTGVCDKVCRIWRSLSKLNIQGSWQTAKGIEKMVENMREHILGL